MASRKTVLVLHGYSQNATILSKRLAALRKECENSVELVFVDAPHPLLPVDLGGSATLKPLNETGSTGAKSDPSLLTRAWWRVSTGRSETLGLNESILFIRNILKTRIFDGIFGFSQGASFATIIAALLERPHLYPPFLVDGRAPHPPLKFCIAVSGFRLRDPFCDMIFPYSTPTLHIIGRTDIVITEERTLRLAEESENYRIEEHNGGHFVPSKTRWLKFLSSYMQDHLADLPTPSSPSSSTPGSGTATPTGRTVYLWQ